MKLPLDSISHDGLRSCLSRIEHELSDAGVELDIADSSDITYAGDKSLTLSGYFVEKRGVPMFGVATGADDWHTVALHEYCHFTQWREKSTFWTAADLPTGTCANFGGIDDALTLLSAWSDNRTQLSREQLERCCRVSRDLELDCERRTVALMKAEGLPFDTDEYTRKANAYIFSYSMIPIFGSNFVVAPHDEEQVWSAMPKTFGVDYDVAWHRFVSLYWKHCFSPQA